MRRIGLLAALLALALAASACGKAEIPAAGGSPRPSPRPSSTAALDILSPKPGDVIKGTTVKLRLKLDGARIVQASTKALKPDEGHLHVLLDGQLITQTAAIQTDIPNVAPGQHTIRVEFVAGDHAPFDPRVFEETLFQVSA